MSTAVALPNLIFSIGRFSRPLSADELTASPCSSSSANPSPLDSPRMILPADDATLVVSDELLQELLMFCDASSLNALAATCHHLRRLLNDAHWWKRKFAQDTGTSERPTSVPLDAPNWNRVAYSHISRTQKSWRVYEASFDLKNVAVFARSSGHVKCFSTFRFPISSADSSALVANFVTASGFSTSKRNIRTTVDGAPVSLMVINERLAGDDAFLMQLGGASLKICVHIRATAQVVVVTVLRTASPQASHGELAPATKLADYLISVNY